jgi:hypothetical protein
MVHSNLEAKASMCRLCTNPSHGVDQDVSDRGWMLDDVMLSGPEPQQADLFLSIILKQE